MSHASSPTYAVLLSAGLSSCAPPVEPIATVESEIQNPTGESRDQWLADVRNAGAGAPFCTGSLIAASSITGGNTNVAGTYVLTARHCVDEQANYEVQFPHAPNAPSRQSRLVYYSPRADLALVPFTNNGVVAGVLPTVPQVAAANQLTLHGIMRQIPPADPAWDPAHRFWFRGPEPVTTLDGSFGPLYRTPYITNPGDSGGGATGAGGCGPDILQAVHLGRDGTSSVLTRTDVSANHNWLEIQVARQPNDPPEVIRRSCGQFIEAHGYPSNGAICESEQGTGCDLDSSRTTEPNGECARCCSRGEERPLANNRVVEEPLPGTHRSFGLAQDAKGKLVMFVARTDDPRGNVLAGFRQAAPGARQWNRGDANRGTVWEWLRFATSIEVARNRNGLLEVFFLANGFGGAVGGGWIYNMYQYNPGDGGDPVWSAPSPLVRELVLRFAVGANADGRLEVAYVKRGNESSGELKHVYQEAPSLNWIGPASWDVQATEVKFANNQDGRLEVFYTDTTAKLRHVWIHQGAWVNEPLATSGIRASSIEPILGPDGAITVFFIGDQMRPYYMRQAVPNGGWAAERTVFAAPTPTSQLSATIGGDNRLRVAYALPDRTLGYATETTPGVFLKRSLNGLANKIRLVRNRDSRVQLLYLGTDDRLYSQFITSVWRPL